MPPPQEWVFDRFGGMDTESDPAGLFTGWARGEPIVTDDALNVYGDGTFVTKRPGLSAPLLTAALSAPLYDLSRARLQAAGSGGDDQLVTLWGPSGGVAKVGFWNGTDTTWSPNATAMPADDLRLARLDESGLSDLMPTPVTAGANWATIKGPPYDVLGFASPTAADAYKIAAWFREHYVLAGNTSAARADQVRISDRGNPRAYTAGTTFTLDAMGIRLSVLGMISLGDALLMGRIDDCYRLTGSSADTFRREKISVPFGFVGKRSGFVLPGGGQAIVITARGQFNASTGTAEVPQPDNVARLAADSGEMMGTRVLTLIRQGGDVSIGARCEYWPDLSGGLLIPRIYYNTTTSPVAAFVHLGTGSFWKWSLSAAQGPCSIEYAGAVLYVGGADGNLYKFSGTASGDNATTFSSYYALPPLWIGEQFAIEYVDVFGTQTSGGTWSVEVARDFGSYSATGEYASQSVTISSTARRARAQWTSARSGYINQVRVTFPTNGVGCKLYRIVVGYKRTGGA